MRVFVVLGKKRKVIEQSRKYFHFFCVLQKDIRYLQSLYKTKSELSKQNIDYQAIRQLIDNLRTSGDEFFDKTEAVVLRNHERS